MLGAHHGGGDPRRPQRVQKRFRTLTQGRARRLHGPRHGGKLRPKRRSSLLRGIPCELRIGILQQHTHGVPHRLPVRLRVPHHRKSVPEPRKNSVGGVAQRIVKVKNDGLIIHACSSGA